MIFDNDFTFEQHLCSVSSPAAQKIGLLRKSFKVYHDQLILQSFLNFFILPSVEYCSPVWSLQQLFIFDCLILYKHTNLIID